MLCTIMGGMTTSRNTTSTPAEPAEPAQSTTSPSQTPSRGRMVFVSVEPESNNGDDYAPAIITRVFNDRLINVRVLPDSNKIPEWRTSVELHDERPETAGHHAWWPPRVS